MQTRKAWCGPGGLNKRYLQLMSGTRLLSSLEGTRLSGSYAGDLGQPSCMLAQTTTRIDVVLHITNQNLRQSCKRLHVRRTQALNRQIQSLFTLGGRCCIASSSAACSAAPQAGLQTTKLHHGRQVRQRVRSPRPPPGAALVTSTAGMLLLVACRLRRRSVAANGTRQL